MIKGAHGKNIRREEGLKGSRGNGEALESDGKR